MLTRTPAGWSPSHTSACASGDSSYSLHGANALPTGLLFSFALSMPHSPPAPPCLCHRVGPSIRQPPLPPWLGTELNFLELEQGECSIGVGA